MSKRINRDDIDRLHDYSLHLPTRTVFLETPLNDDGDEHGVGYAMAQRVIKNLRILDHVSDAPITLIINTNGGDICTGMGIYDAIRACRSPIRGLVVGNANSMGSVLLQACDIRASTPHSTIMYHAGTMDGASGAPFREGIRAVKYEEHLGDIIDRIMYERVKTAKPKLSYEKFKVETDRGIYCTPAQALEWGFLDEVEQ